MTAAAVGQHTLLGSERKKKELLARLARVQGQIGGIRGMVEREEDCEKIAQQVSAARAALKGAFYELVACAFECKMAPAGCMTTQVQKRIDELSCLMSRYG